MARGIAPSNAQSAWQSSGRLTGKQQSTTIEWCVSEDVLLDTASQNKVDLMKVVQVVGRFQADKFLERLPSVYFVNASTPPTVRAGPTTFLNGQRPKIELSELLILVWS